MDLDDLEELTPAVNSLSLEPLQDVVSKSKTFTRSIPADDEDLDYAESDDYT